MAESNQTGRNGKRRGSMARKLTIWRALFNARMRNYLLTGILVTAPITITVWISWKILQLFDATARHMVPDAWYPDIAVPGLGLIVVAVLAFILLYYIKSLSDPDFCRSEQHIQKIMRIELETMGNEGNQLRGEVIEADMLKQADKEPRALFADGHKPLGKELG